MDYWGDEPILRGHQRHLHAELALWVEVVYMAWLDMRSADRDLVSRAMNWVNEEGMRCGSFDWICCCCSINAEKLRLEFNKVYARRLDEWRKRSKMRRKHDYSQGPR